MSGGADVGGDGSVQWFIWGDDVVPGRLINRPRGASGHEQGHVDRSDPAEEFSISIEVPRNAAAFAASIAGAAAAAQNAAPGARVEFTLPIEPKHVDQIRIRWERPHGAALMGSVPAPKKSAASRARLATRKPNRSMKSRTSKRRKKIR